MQAHKKFIEEPKILALLAKKQGMYIMKPVLKINPQILYTKNNKAKGVLLKPKEFNQLIELLEDLDDALSVYQRTHGKKIVGIPAEKVWKKVFGK